MSIGMSARRALARTPLRPFLTAVKTVDILERRYGHFRSSREWAAVDGTGRPVPWYTYPCIEYLRQVDLSGKRVFEYGSGNSTRFWGAVSREVTAVEDDPDWYEKVRTTVPVNCTVLLETDRDAYVTRPGRTGGLHDVVIIDGSHRAACAREAVPHLAPGGLVVLDNADWYPKTAAYLRSQDLVQVDFTGFTPINAYTATTSLFLRRDVRLSPAGPVQPVPGTGGIPQLAADDY